MKIRAKANGEVIDIDEEGATLLIEAGIYERADDHADERVDDASASTTVKPLTTDSMPIRAKRVR